jgi:endoglucanase
LSGRVAAVLLVCAAALSLSAAEFDGPILASARPAAPTHRSADNRASMRSHRRRASLARRTTRHPRPHKSTATTAPTGQAGSNPASQPTTPPAPPSSLSSPPSSLSSPPSTTSPAATPPGGGAGTVSGNPFAGRRFYADPQSPAATSQRQFAAAGDTTDARLMAKVSSGPTAKWFGGWSYGHGGTAGDVNWWVTTVTSAGDLPVLVAYDIPWRDCGSYSSGGAPDATAYQSFINGMAQGKIGRAHV